MIAKSDNTAEAMNGKQYRLVNERQHTQTVDVSEPSKGSTLGRFKLVFMAAIAFMMTFWPAMAFAQEATLTDVNATVEVVSLFNYGTLAMTYLTTTGTVYAVLAGVLITIGIAASFIRNLSHKRGM